MARLKLAQCFEVLVYVLRRRGRRVSGSVRRRLGLSHPLGNRKGFESLSDTCCVSLAGVCKNEPRSASQSQSTFRIGLGGSRRRILRGVILFAGQSQSIFSCGTCDGDSNPDDVQASRPKTPECLPLPTFVYFSLPYSTFCGFSGAAICQCLSMSWGPALWATAPAIPGVGHSGRKRSRGDPAGVRGG